MTPRNSAGPISFPLDDVEIIQTDDIRRIDNPVYSNEWMSITPREFAMTVSNVGSFYAGDGKRIEYAPEQKVDPSAIELFLNGSVYGAILHQRQILPLHGSSFIYKNSGIMFCGESGAGKSSLTASFCLNGADFLTDDVTPILFEENQPHIWPKSGKVKLWNDSLQHFNREKSEFTKIRPGDEKYYYPIKSKQEDPFSLDQILILEITDSEKITFKTVEKVEAFSYLHRQIYRREFLWAMPETETSYLEQISMICKNVDVSRVSRPAAVAISDMRKEVSHFLSVNP